MIRIAIVTGHEISSDLSIADLFASLKSAHIADEPVTLTSTCVAAGGGQRPLEVARGAHHLVRVAAGAGLDHGGAAVLRDRDALARRHYLADVRVAGEGLLGVGERGLEGGVVDGRACRS